MIQLACVIIHFKSFYSAQNILNTLHQQSLRSQTLPEFIFPTQTTSQNIQSCKFPCCWREYFLYTGMSSVHVHIIKLFNQYVFMGFTLVAASLSSTTVLIFFQSTLTFNDPASSLVSSTDSLNIYPISFYKTLLSNSTRTVVSRVQALSALSLQYQLSLTGDIQ